ncbi:MAG TPA: hypothetical protein VJZ27_16415 [Aggregatilineales bacterium]|nr:hypothetical protein [Aggregatilineales bacterium]
MEDYSTTSAYLTQKPDIKEFESMNFAPKTIERLRTLLDAEAVRALTFQEQAELDAFVQAAFYIRMNHAA